MSRVGTHRSGKHRPRDRKYNSIERNSWLWLYSWKSLDNLTKIFFVTSISGELLLDLLNQWRTGILLILPFMAKYSWNLSQSPQLLPSGSPWPLVLLPGKPLTSDTMKLVNGEQSERETVLKKCANEKYVSEHEDFYYQKSTYKDLQQLTAIFLRTYSLHKKRWKCF
jgi:hypothetical protein